MNAAAAASTWPPPWGPTGAAATLRLQPLVLGPATLPVVTDPAVAEKEIALAILSAMAHGNGPDGLAQQLIDRGIRGGEVKGLREALLRLVARAAISLMEQERARIQACEDSATLDRWIENVFGAKSTADVFS